jgi:hypothetical protein
MVKATVPHIPPGGTFIKPPTNDGEIYMGSMTVVVEGEPFPFMGMQVLTCQEFGMPSIPRLNRKSKSKPMSLMLPTSVLLPVGGNVIASGAPGIMVVVPDIKPPASPLGKLKKMKSVSHAL